MVITYSITTSARRRSSGDSIRPRIWAVLRLADLARAVGVSCSTLQRLKLRRALPTEIRRATTGGSMLNPPDRRLHPTSPTSNLIEGALSCGRLITTNVWMTALWLTHRADVCLVGVLSTPRRPLRTFDHHLCRVLSSGLCPPHLTQGFEMTSRRSRMSSTSL